jgi:hypothetical protein
MKSLNSAYKSQRGTDKSSVYLFILDKGQVGDSNPAGELPRGKQFGYLFTGNGGDIDWTIAHELGHGLFRLQHTFDGEYGGTAKSLKAQTDNLMDYGGGTHLAKWQWDEIHDPALLVNPFEGDEDSMRKDESERGEITRYIYAVKDAIQNQINFINSKKLTSKDIKKINSKTDFQVKADHIFYNEHLKDFFEEMMIQFFFYAKQRKGQNLEELSFSDHVGSKIYTSVYVKSIDAIIAFSFKNEQDLLKFKSFIGEEEIMKPPVSTTRKAFFVHGTQSNSDRWLEHPLAENALLCIANTNQYDDKFSWTEYNGLLQQATLDIGFLYRNLAAQDLINYVLNNSQGFNEIVLIGHSHGGNVSLQAVNQLTKKGKSVYLITVATPAFNEPNFITTILNILQNCELESNIGGIHVYKNPENPGNTQLVKHIHLWNKEDKVAGEVAGNDFYKSNGVTENIEIPTEDEYSTVCDIFLMMTLRFNAHGFDASRPQLIYKMLFNGRIKKME